MALATWHTLPMSASKGWVVQIGKSPNLPTKKNQRHRNDRRARFIDVHTHADEVGDTDAAL